VSIRYGWKRGNDEVVPCPVEQAIAALICKRRALGWSYFKIAKSLRFPMRAGTPWTMIQVHRVVKNTPAGGYDEKTILRKEEPESDVTPAMIDAGMLAYDDRWHPGIGLEDARKVFAETYRAMRQAAPETGAHQTTTSR
jgi:hypothetical protein